MKESAAAAALLALLAAPGASVEAATTASIAATIPHACSGDFASQKFCDTSLPTAERVAALVSELTLDEKAAMMTARESPKGGVDRLGVPEYDWGANCIHGVQSRCLGDVCPTSFPNPNALGTSWNREQWRGMGAVIGWELRALWLANVGENHASNLPHLGLDCWSPNVNLARDPRWGRNLEVPGEDPLLNGAFGAEYSKGLQNGPDPAYLQAVTTLKHWAVYNLEDWHGVDRHHFNAVVSPHDLADSYWPAFRASIEGGAKGIMCSYNAVNGTPSCASDWLLNRVARQAWGFDGYITSDSGAIDDIWSAHNFTKDGTAGVAAAIKATCDIDSSLAHGPSAGGSPYMDHIPDAVKAGLLDEAEVDAAVSNALKIRFELGLFDPIEDQTYWHVPMSDVSSARARAASLAASVEGAVLLRNDGGDVLPFKKGQKVAVIGPHAKAQQALVGNYIGQICPGNEFDMSCVEAVDAALTAANGADGSVTAELGCADVPCANSTGFAAAVAAAKAADVVVLAMGLDVATIEKEGHDRESLLLPGMQADLAKQVLAAGKPTVMALIHGGSVDISPVFAAADSSDVAAAPPRKARATPVRVLADYAAAAAADQKNVAVMSLGYPGVYGAHALAKLVFGDESPSGKATTTWMPEKYATDVSLFDVGMTDAPGRTYRYYDGSKGAPLFEFGRGLSYAAFSLALQPGSPAAADLQQPAAADADASRLFRVNVTNTGPRVAGKEVVMAYFSPDASVALAHPPLKLPARQLLGFEKTPTLWPGDSAQVEFRITAADLALVDSRGDAVSAPGLYHLTFDNGNNAVATADVTVGGSGETVVRPFIAP